jgi:hypothetical protein
VIQKEFYNLKGEGRLEANFFFQTCVYYDGKVCDLFINRGTMVNVILEDVVKKLKLPM